jgi:Urocanase Rossmann-like domain
MLPETDTLQAHTLRAFTLLLQTRPDCAGTLILNINLNEEGTALALASNIAGAVCLTLEPNPTLLRNAMRNGACDFVVNTLDEALRAMKNEIRKHRPLSVGLEGNPETILQEILERGVLPQLFTNRTRKQTATAFLSQGAITLNQKNVTPPNPQWQLQTFTFNTPAELSAFDAQALNLLPPEDTLRRRWLQTAPRILHREQPLHRTLWLTDKEIQLLSPPA